MPSVQGTRVNLSVVLRAPLPHWLLPAMGPCVQGAGSLGLPRAQVAGTASPHLPRPGSERGSHCRVLHQSSRAADGCAPRRC